MVGGNLAPSIFYTGQYHGWEASSGARFLKSTGSNPKPYALKPKAYPRSPGTHIVGPWVTDSIKSGLRGQSLPLRFATFHKRNYAKGLCFAGFHHWNYIKRVCFAGFHRKNYIKGLRLATVRNRSYVRANDFAAIIPIIIINIFLILTFRLLL